MTCHTCKPPNPGCVNAAHLYPGNGKRNSGDRDENGSPIAGEKCHLAKLTEKQVLQIIELDAKFLAAGHRYGRIPKIAELVGCSKRSIEHILQGDSWCWLTKKSRNYI